VLRFGGWRRSGIVLLLPSAQDFPAAGAVQCGVVVFGAEIIVATSAGAFPLERLMAADDAVPVVDLVAAEARADRTALGDDHPSLLPFAAQPARRVHRWSTVADLEVQVRRVVGVGDADCADVLSLGDGVV